MSLNFPPNPARAGGLPTDPAGLDAYIRDFIMRNPQVVRDALLQLEADEQTANAKRVLRGLKDSIYGAGSPAIGNPDAKITIVEFFDYNCPYCRSSYPAIKAYIAANPDTRLILKDVASLGKESQAVAKVVIAATRQGKFAALHDALMTSKGRITEAVAIDAAVKLGADIDRLKKDAQSPAAGETLARNQQLAEQLNVSTTPLFIIGHNGIPGAPDDLVSQIGQHVDQIRKSGCDVC